ncbi:hypothetical protein BDN72DRAFT_905111 [Pluteus cervinus]|uniref:Uncharacterized protein n=1 Tax=Pluteus cervinus TaxID=181527 RepID=A0ACD3A3P6_9AGAR|nr:hypothetical protein BDN72DRAFT_905111 [Pluteus cervinus]
MDPVPHPSLCKNSSLPRLPIELQDEIFRLAARKNPEIAATLAQVSKWVAERVYPILYEIVFFENPVNEFHIFDPPPIAKRSFDIDDILKQHGRHVRCLWLDPPQDRKYYDFNVGSVFKSCPSLKNLSLGYACSVQVLRTIEEGLPNLERLWGMLKLCPDSLSALKPTHKRLTHLYLFEIYHWDTLPTFLLGLPSLTHLGVNDVAECDMVEEGLKGCKQLQAVLLVADDEDTEETCMATTSEVNSEDERIVFVTVSPFSNWLSGARGGFDMWELADRIILERRKRREGNGT